MKMSIFRYDHFKILTDGANANLKKFKCWRRLSDPLFEKSIKKMCFFSSK